MINFYCTVEREPDRYTKAYIAKITGRHPKYALRRDFQLVRILTTPTVVKLRSELDNGVYECCIQQVNSKTHDVVKTERWFATRRRHSKKYASQSNGKLPCACTTARSSCRIQTI